MRLRPFLTLQFLLLLVFITSLFTGGASAEADIIQYGAAVNPTGNPIGGGPGYSDIILGGDIAVQTKEEFLQALKTAEPGEVVYIEPDAEIDLTGLSNIPIPGGITLAGNRGYQDSPGPLVFTNDLTAKPLFDVVGPDTRITGIRLQGPDGEVRETRDGYPTSTGIQTDFDNLEVDNNEIYNWSFAGVNIYRGRNAYIHHNYIHHCQRTGLGYPVVVAHGTMLVEANKFDYYRHAIAGSGYLGSGYEARYNLALEHSISHTFDMHGGTDFCARRSPSDPCTAEELWMAGDWVKIHHNTFLNGQYHSIVIRGVPREMVEVYDNWFVYTDPTRAFLQEHYQGNVWVHNNAYGDENRVIAKYIEPSPLIFQCLSRYCSPGNKGELVAIAPRAGAVMDFAPPLNEERTEVHGLLPVDAEVDLAGLLKIEQIRILLDNEPIYSDAMLPTGNLMVDTLKLDDGTHELTLEVTADRNSVLRKRTTIAVDNWWDMQVEMKPPLSSGWFGSLDLSRSSSMSSGWTYVTDNPEEFAGDENRAVRTSANLEFFIWGTPSLQKLAVDLFSATPDLTGVRLEGSADKNSWFPLPLVSQDQPIPGSDWHKVQLGAVVDQLEVNFIRLTVEGQNPPEDLQVGAVHFIGLNTGEK